MEGLVGMGEESEPRARYRVHATAGPPSNALRAPYVKKEMSKRTAMKYLCEILFSRDYILKWCETSHRIHHYTKDQEGTKCKGFIPNLNQDYDFSNIYL